MEELEKNNRIKQEYDRINIFFEELNENQKAVISPLIQNASFMRVTLEDLQKIISEQGPVEQYRNGENQYGMKQSAALQSYNALMKNYAAVIKTLECFLPAMKKILPWQPKEKTDEEIEQEEREAEEQRKKSEAELAYAIEFQNKRLDLQAKINAATSEDERKRLSEELKSLRYSFEWRE